MYFTRVFIYVLKLFFDRNIHMGAETELILLDMSDNKLKQSLEEKKLAYLLSMSCQKLLHKYSN